MKESVGYTVTLNIVIVFIVIVLAFISAALIYFKSNKVSNVITETVQKYEGYNQLSKDEIGIKITTLGYNKKPVDCNKYFERINSNLANGQCQYDDSNGNDGSEGYCIFVCNEEVDGDSYYYYKISTNLMLNLPLINSFFDIPIFSDTSRLYDFSENLPARVRNNGGNSETLENEEELIEEDLED